MKFIFMGDLLLTTMQRYSENQYATFNPEIRGAHPWAEWFGESHTVYVIVQKSDRNIFHIFLRTKGRLDEFGVDVPSEESWNNDLVHLIYNVKGGVWN